MLGSQLNIVATVAEDQIVLKFHGPRRIHGLLLVVLMSWKGMDILSQPAFVELWEVLHMLLLDTADPPTSESEICKEHSFVTISKFGEMPQS